MDDKIKINEAAIASFEKVEASVGDAKVQLRELSEAEMSALEKIIYVQKSDGSGPEVDGEGKLTIADGFAYLNNWIAATIIPQFSIEEIAGWPRSLKKKLLEKAKQVNGYSAPAEAIAKNS